MRRFVYGLALVAVTACAPSVNVDDEQNALLARDRQWSQVATDVDGFMSYLAADATVYSPGAPAMTGADEIRSALAEAFSMPNFSLNWTPAEARVAASGDIGYTSGTYEMSSAQGAEKGKYVTVWRKDGDAWMVVEDIFNADAAPSGGSSQHMMLTTSDLKWGDPPPGLPSGARIAVVSGDPSQAQPFVLRAQVPAGYRVAPHWHPGDENLTVLSGTIALGMGEQFDESAMTAIGPGGYAALPAEMRHYFLARSAATFQVHGMGPFVLKYVNPADDPGKSQP